MKTAIILASGLGKRMESDLPKVLHKVSDLEMVNHVISLVESVGVGRIIVVVGYKSELVKAAIKKDVEFVFQPQQLGTGHAIQVVKQNIKDISGTVLVLAGDMPLIRKETLENMISNHESNGAAVTVLSSELENPFGYGRVIIDANSHVDKIVEEKDATDQEKEVVLVNTGAYCFDGKNLFELIDLVGNNNNQGEYYLTDVVSLANQKGYKVLMSQASNAYEATGVNTKDQLIEAEMLYNKYIKGDK
jgi:bifunctional UDP-N-acetylglucosamine pyrophosphorylase/glucosamine-1-phosphate N-acetyltransferase